MAGAVGCGRDTVPLIFSFLLFFCTYVPLLLFNGVFGFMLVIAFEQEVMFQGGHIIAKSFNAFLGRFHGLMCGIYRGYQSLFQGIGINKFAQAAFAGAYLAGYAGK